MLPLRGLGVRDATFCVEQVTRQWSLAASQTVLDSGSRILNTCFSIARVR